MGNNNGINKGLITRNIKIALNIIKLLDKVQHPKKYEKAIKMIKPHLEKIFEEINN